MTVGERIKKRREELGLSQSELAKKMGYAGKSTVCRAETYGNNITTDKIRKYAKALDCTEAELVGWNEDAKVERQLSGIVAEEDIRLLTMYTKLDDNDKQLIKQMIYSLLLKKG